MAPDKQQKSAYIQTSGLWADSGKAASSQIRWPAGALDITRVSGSDALRLVVLPSSPFVLLSACRLASCAMPFCTLICKSLVYLPLVLQALVHLFLFTGPLFHLPLVHWLVWLTAACSVTILSNRLLFSYHVVQLPLVHLSSCPTASCLRALLSNCLVFTCPLPTCSLVLGATCLSCACLLCARLSVLTAFLPAWTPH